MQVYLDCDMSAQSQASGSWCKCLAKLQAAPHRQITDHCRGISENVFRKTANCSTVFLSLVEKEVEHPDAIAIQGRPVLATPLRPPLLVPKRRALFITFCNKTAEKNLPPHTQPHSAQSVSELLFWLWAACFSVCTPHTHTFRPSKCKKLRAQSRIQV